jgi:cell division inhibitor SulA
MMLPSKNQREIRLKTVKKTCWLEITPMKMTKTISLCILKQLDRLTRVKITLRPSKKLAKLIYTS